MCNSTEKVLLTRFKVLKNLNGARCKLLIWIFNNLLHECTLLEYLKNLKANSENPYVELHIYLHTFILANGTSRTIKLHTSFSSQRNYTFIFFFTMQVIIPANVTPDLGLLEALYTCCRCNVQKTLRAASRDYNFFFVCLSANS